MDGPAGELADPGVIRNMGKARVPSSRAVWLSKVTARGVAMTSVSESLFRNESTALTPSAFKKAVAGLRPWAVSAKSLGLLKRPPGILGVAGNKLGGGLGVVVGLGGGARGE